jgi:hypothetical protein
MSDEGLEKLADGAQPEDDDEGLQALAELAGNKPAELSAAERSDLESRKEAVKGKLRENESDAQTANTLEGVLKPVTAAASGVAEMAVPFGKRIAEAITPGDTQQNAKTLDAAQKAHPVLAATGKVAGALAGGAIGGAALEGAGIAANTFRSSAAIAAGQGAVNRIGELMHEDAMEARPLLNEHLLSAFSWQNLGLDALVGVATHGVIKGGGKLVDKAIGKLESSAQKSAEKLVDKDSLSAAVSKGVKKSGLTEPELASKMRAEKVFTRGEAEKFVEKTGQKLEDALDGTTVDVHTIRTMDNLDSFTQKLEQTAENVDEDDAFRFISNETNRLGANGPYRDQVGRPQSFYSVAKKFRKYAQANSLPADHPVWTARQIILDGLESTISSQKPELAGEFSAALTDYRVGLNLQRFLKNETSQVTGADIKGAAIKAGIKAGAAMAAEGAGLATGHPLVAGGVALTTAASGAKDVAALGNRSFARVLNDMVGVAQRNWAKSVSTLDRLFAPGAFASGNLLGHLTDKQVDKAYDDAKAHLESAQADPMAHVQAIQETLTKAGVPAQVVDSASAKAMQDYQQMTNVIPKSPAPASVFGSSVDHITGQQKRDFLRKLICAKDPHAAVMSGDPALIKWAEQFNPETLQQLREATLARINRPGVKIPYRVQLQLAGCLGGAALPSQDPIVGAGLQANISDQNFKNSQEGQVNSARQNKAISAQQKGMVTKSQALGAAGDAQLKEEQGR